MTFSRTLGCTLIVSGTAIGAGMLALPVVSQRVNFSLALVLLVGVWALMMYCALLIVEVTLSFKSYRNNFSTMTREILGKPGQITMWLASILLLYSLTAAYISGSSSLLSRMMNHFLDEPLAPTHLAFLFTLVFGSIVSFGVHQVDRVNRGLMILKAGSLFATLVLLTPQIHFSKLITEGSYTSQALWGMIPVFLTSFAFHHVIPSLANHIGQQPQSLVRAIRWGSTVPLIIYIFWLATVLGVVPREALQHVDQGAETNIGHTIQLIGQFAHSKWATIGVDIFSDVALLTSFLGVTLGLFDFMADACHRSYTLMGRIQTALITFVPPLLFAMYYPSGFILALGYAAIFVAIMQIIMPALMVFKKRQRNDLPSSYRAPGGTVSLIFTGSLGVLLIMIQAALSLHWL